MPPDLNVYSTSEKSQVLPWDTPILDVQLPEFVFLNYNAYNLKALIK